MKIFRSALFAPVAILILAMLCSAIILNVRTIEYLGWYSTEGVLQERVQLHSLKDRIYYTFTLDDTTYNGSDVLHRDVHTPPTGSVITVWYDADDYTRTSYGSRPSAEFDSWAPFFIAVPLSCAILLQNVLRDNSSIK